MGDVKEATSLEMDQLMLYLNVLRKLYPHDVNLQLYNVHAVMEGTMLKQQ